MNEKEMNKEFFNRDAEQVARELLGKIISVNGKKAKIVETEAYFGEEDPASRACKNGDLKETMKQKGGTILVYGVHNQWLMNIVTGKKGEASAVLLRAAEPLNFSEKCSGPGLLTRALKIDKEFHKKNIFDNGNLKIVNDNKFDDGRESRKLVNNRDNDNNFEIVESKRIGVKKDLPRKLRFYIKDNKFVSKK